MLTKNQIGKYILYAIGEIILVVIGILIALSINNWNNNNLRTNEEMNALSNMLLDLNLDINAINNALKIHENTLKTHIKFRKILLKQSPANDSIGFFIRMLNSSSTPTFSSSTYKTISQTGLNLIQNDSLRNSIVKYYETLIPYLNEKANLDPKFQFQILLKPYYIKHLKLELNPNGSMKHSVNNLKKLLNDNEFLNELNLSINFRRRIIRHHKIGIKHAESLTQIINNELKNRNN